MPMVNLGLALARATLRSRFLAALLTSAPQCGQYDSQLGTGLPQSGHAVYIMLFTSPLWPPL